MQRLLRSGKSYIMLPAEQKAEHKKVLVRFDPLSLPFMASVEFSTSNIRIFAYICITSAALFGGG